ncbi:hypothetical protein KUTeg_005738 [Tegillarca granosa]|uniref:Negative elongation factor D n=1 Tax=Tegillarca granosa TaxID=220873 RepID=A0ABQ9FLX0_TEGGR|nr:hypothetical protein KUTeg_005738 [Tegillarca granosa]
MADYDDDDPMWDDGGESPDQEDEEENMAIQQECLGVFSSKDYIMEPGVFNMLKRFLQAGGSPEKVVELLSDNYTAVAQTVNLLAEWLIQAAMILKHFDPKKADSIFTDEGETPSWLAEMIEFPTWRELFYKLAEEYPDCLMLNFTVKIEVFSRVLRTSITSLLEGGEDAVEKNLPEFTKMVCHGEHTYLYSQVLMHILAQETKGGSNIRRLCQELQKSANEKGLDLFKMYSEMNPPPVDLIRVPAFLDLLIEALFKPTSRVNPEHKQKYVYVLAYAASVTETYKKGQRKNINRDELKPTTQALEKVQGICAENKSSSDLIADIATLFMNIKFPVIAFGILKWVDYTVSDASYFKLNTDHTPLHLVLIDEIVTNHVLLHQKALDLLVRIFESSFEELDVLVQLELKKTVLDRIVHLFSRGFVIPVVTYIRKCLDKQDTDISLIRHFVTEVLDVIAPPYTPEFMQLFLPLLENKAITGSIILEDGKDPVSEFISFYEITNIINQQQHTQVRVEE